MTTTIIFPSDSWLRKIIAGIFLTVFILTFSNTVSAQGIGVAPDRLSAEAVQGETVRKQIIVFNPSDEPVIFSVHAEKLNEWISFYPKEALLPGRESKKVFVEIKSKSAGSYRDTIYVTLNSDTNNNSLALQLAAAVSAELFVKSKQNKLVGAAVTSSIPIFGLLCYILCRRYKHISFIGSLW